jgi:hypothetical protein
MDFFIVVSALFILYSPQKNREMIMFHIRTFIFYAFVLRRTNAGCVS